MKFNLLNLSLALLVPQALAMPKDDTPTGFEEKDFIPTATNVVKSSTSTIQATKAADSKTSSEFDYSNVTCTNLNMGPFSSKCSKRTGTVTYTTLGYNCIVSARCIFDGTTVSFNSDNYTFPPTETETIISSPTNTSTNGHCGSKDGKCPSGECCSKYGWCGTSADHCSVKKGCQSEFGKCIDDQPTELPVSTNDRCGSKDGKCPSGKCCSKHGWCGTSADHCSVKKGCQSEFGKCSDDQPTELPVSTNDRCGSKDGKCPSGKCCSKHGWCGTSADYCSVKKGCQSEFGKCSDDQPAELPVSTNDRCGSKDGKCPSGKCCSKHGWCGTSDDHCSTKKGCQSEFGKCK